MVLPASRGVPRAPRYSGDLLGRRTRFDYGGVTLCAAAFQPPRLRLRFVTSRCLCKGITEIPTTPCQQRLHAYTGRVWARPLSLATTRGVSVDFFSCRYLDVSVPCVGSGRSQWFRMTGTGFPHSGISGSTLVCQLPGAYRRLLRPSSPPGAKASTMCP